MDYVRVFYKRRWVAIPAFLIVFAVGAINSYRTTPIYEARTQILIEKDTPKVGTPRTTMFQQQDGWYNDDFYQTQYRILQSRSLARRTAELMHLKERIAAHNATAPVADDGFSVSGAIAWVKRQVAGEDAQEATKAADAAKVAAALAKEDPLAPYASMVLGSLAVSPVRNSRLVDLQLHLHRSAAGRRHGQRAREGLHRAEPRVQVLRVEGRHRLAERAAGRAAQEGRGERGRAAALQGAARRRRRRGSPEHRRAAAGET